jgi:putative ABC transport system permease protein
MLFLSESLALCAIAGVIGLLIGFVAYELAIFAASKFVAKLGFAWVAEPVAIFISLVSIVVVGILSGLAPAIKAEKLQIAEALRSE